jgi:hypothetical protein
MLFVTCGGELYYYFFSRLFLFCHCFIFLLGIVSVLNISMCMLIQLMNRFCFVFIKSISAVFQMKVHCKKESIHSFLKCRIDELTTTSVASGNWSQQKIDTLRQTMNDFDVLIIEEVSTTSASLWVGCDVMLRRIFNKDKSFGGKTVLMISFYLYLYFGTIKITSRFLSF